MLTIKVEEEEFYDRDKEQFFYTKPVIVRLEHSLKSIAKWEAVWQKAYLPTPNVTPGISGFKEEVFYIECMIIGTVPPHIPAVLWEKHYDKIREYLNNPYSATTIHRRGPERPPSRRIITAELIYYWMIELGVPFECEKWHFNRLITLIQVCNVKKNVGKGSNLSSREAMQYQNQLNRARRAAL